MPTGSYHPQNGERKRKGYANMETILADGEWLAVTVPEGFEVIPHDELESLMGFKYDRMWGVRDAERHMVLSVTWKDSGKILTKLSSEKFLAKRADEVSAKRYRNRGYRSGGRFARAITGASAQAQGLRYSYEAEGIAHDGEALVFKRGARCYMLSYNTRSALAAENRPAYEAILDSLEVR